MSDLKSFLIVTVLAMLCIASSSGQVLSAHERTDTPAANHSDGIGPASDDYAGKKIFWVDSYSLTFEWSAGIARGIRGVLKHTDVEFTTAHMDSKSCPNDECIKAAAEKVRAVIEAFRPDVLIASDDNT